ncbi:MAG: SRPBCC family protein [Chloroflexota bacterium]
MNQIAVVAQTQMLIRRPVSEVFEALIDPEITSKFWFTKSSGRLEPGKRLKWDWEMYNVSAEVDVKVVEPNSRIYFHWPYDGASTAVEWVFTRKSDDTTFVSVTNSGFAGDDARVARAAISSATGFTFVLAGLKALLEHNLVLNPIGDAHAG